MRIGLYIKWNKGSLQSKANVLGDELYGEQMCKALEHIPGVSHAELYAANHLPPSNGLDVMIYLNDTLPQPNWARRHVLYMQNAYSEGSHEALKGFQSTGFDGYAFISHRLLELHKNDGFAGIFLPFGVDTDLFYPQSPRESFAYDVAYVGSDIKGLPRTQKYIMPATHYHFGLFGYWYVPKVGIKFWRRWNETYRYKKLLAGISQGRIQQEDVPALYSSSKININCTAQDCVDWDVITLRTLEVLACKGFLMSDKVPIAEKILKDCVVFTDGGEDMIDRIDYFLAHETERRDYAENGFEYIQKHATIRARMQELFNYLQGIV